MWPLNSDECYVSVDIEADGPIPGTYSMLSLGAAAFDAEGKLLDTWTANLEQLPDAGEHPRTMRWWAAHSQAWEAARTHPRPPEGAIAEFVAWAEGLRNEFGWPVMVAFPAASRGWQDLDAPALAHRHRHALAPGPRRCGRARAALLPHRARARRAARRRRPRARTAGSGSADGQRVPAPAPGGAGETTGLTESAYGNIGP